MVKQVLSQFTNSLSKMIEASEKGSQTISFLGTFDEKQAVHENS
jgi:hypothetical protein